MVPKIIEGGVFTDHRGAIAYVNDFKFENIVRFYIVRHPDTETVRAWQGHRIEQKWYYVVKGAFVVAWVKIGDRQKPSENLKAEYKVLHAGKSEILHIPAGYANGLKALEADSEVLVFSDFGVDESVKEKIRFDPELWFDWDSCSSIKY